MPPSVRGRHNTSWKKSDTDLRAMGAGNYRGGGVGGEKYFDRIHRIDGIFSPPHQTGTGDPVLRPDREGVPLFHTLLRKMKYNSIHIPHRRCMLIAAIKES